MEDSSLLKIASRIQNQTARDNWLKFMRGVELQSDEDELIEARDYNGIASVYATALPVIEKMRYEELGSTLDNPFPVSQQLTMPTGIDAQSVTGDTALHSAVMEGDEALVILLLDRGADKTITNHAGDTPAEIAAQLGEIKILHLLK